jgi:trehalose 6-phosphate phosphatase
VAFDFDGTLAPIVPRPEDATLDPALTPVVERLRPLLGWLAVISGRDRAFLAQHVNGMLMLGSYGLELPSELSATGLPEGFPADAVRDRLDGARRELREELAGLPGSRLEVKPWGLALHYRGAGADFDEGRASMLVAEVGERNGLSVQPGRLVLELKPREIVDKGWALRLLLEHLGPSAVVFIGDDLGDRPAWEAVRASELPGLAVGIASPELPEDALAPCNVVLGSRGVLGTFLGGLISAAEEGRAAGP